MAENTFLGLQPYTEADAYRFKGRTEETQELFRLIVRNDYTVCYAESGEGKTSLLNAGVFPLLRQNMFFPIAITFTSDDYQRTPDSFDTIIDRCITDSIAEYNEKNKGINIEYKLCSTDFQDTDRQSALQHELSNYSWWKLRNYKPQAMGLTFMPVFVFDQFEEVFNLPGSIVWTKKFFDWLEDVSSNSCPDEIVNKVRGIIGNDAPFPAIKEEKDFKAVFSLRKEFIGELDYWSMQKCFIPSLKDNRYCLKALTYDGAKKVMTQQQRFEETKVEQVLRYFVQQYSREPEKTIAENLPVTPALLLSVVCDSWEKDINFFSGKDVDEIGQSLNIILERFYDEAIGSVVNELSQQEGNSQAEAIRKDIETAIFALVDGNGKRVRRKSSELSHLDFDAKYKEILSDNRIIKISKVDGEDYVEVVHDVLCPIIAKRKENYLAAEAKKREEEKLREQAKKNRKRMILMSAVILIISILAIVALIIGTSILNLNKQLQKTIDDRDSALVQIRQDSVILTRHLWRIQRDSLELVLKNERILQQKDSLDYTNDLLAGERDRVIKASWLAIENHARFVSEKALALAEDGDSYLARLLAQNVFSMRTYTPEAEQALRYALSCNSAILHGHTLGLNKAVFSPDNNTIATCADDRSLRIWDVKTGQIIIIIEEPSQISDVTYSTNGKYILTSSRDNNIRIYDTANYKCFSLLEGHTSLVWCVAINRNGDKIASASGDNTIRVWDFQTGECMQILEGHDDDVRSVSFTYDDRIISASYDKTIRIWDSQTGKCLNVLRGHDGPVLCATISPNGKYIASGGTDKSIRIWDAKEGTCLKVINGHSDNVHSLDFSPNSMMLASASWDKTVSIWNTIDWGLIKTCKGHGESVRSVKFNCDGKTIVTASWDRTARIWDVEEKNQSPNIVVGNGEFAMYSPDNKKIIYESGQKVIVQDAISGKLIKVLEGHVADLRHVNISHSGYLIASGGDDRTIRIWDTHSGELIKILRGHENSVRSVAFSPDDKLLVSTSFDRTIRIWDVDAGKLLQVLRGHQAGVEKTFFSPDGKRIVSASRDKTVRVWDVITGKNLFILKGHDNEVFSATYSPDGKYILSASYDRTLRLWNANNGELIRVFRGHDVGVQFASFNSDGSKIVSASDDSTIIIWDTNSGVPLCTFKGHSSNVWSVFFSSDERHIISASHDNTVRIWEFPPLHQLIDETRERFKNRQLTPEERRKYYLE